MARSGRAPALSGPPFMVDCLNYDWPNPQPECIEHIILLIFFYLLSEHGRGKQKNRPFKIKIVVLFRIGGSC